MKPNARAGYKFRGLLVAEVRRYGGTGGRTRKSRPVALGVGLLAVSG